MSNGVNNWSQKHLNIRVFSNRQDMIDKATAALEHNDSKIINASYKDFVDSYYLKDMLNVRLYEKQDKLKEGLDLYDELTVETDMGGAFKKSRLRITDDSRGIFDFGLASRGLFRAIEYYSKELENESPDEFPENLPGIVPDKFVTTKRVSNKSFFYYTSIRNQKEYELTQQQAGFSEMIKHNPNAIIKKTSQGMLYTEQTSYFDQAINKKISLEFKTKNKKSYLIFEKKGGKAKMVEIYFPLHADVKLPQILPLLLVARYLKEAGILTRINVLRMFHEKGDEFVLYGYPLKDYGDELDFNNIALNGVDERWWQAVRVMVRSLNDYNITSKSPSITKRDLVSKAFSGQGGQAGDFNDYVEVFSRYRNWYMKQIEEAKLPPLRVDKKLILFGGVFGGSTKFFDKEEIKKEFFRILDTVDLQFNNAEETCARIYKRTVTNELDKYYLELKKRQGVDISYEMNYKKKELTSKFKSYVTKLLVATYSYPIGGEYEEPKESADKLDEEFEEKIEQLNKFLANV